jgi:hypothetical protein
VLCDNALLSGFALERRPVDSKIVAEVVKDFDLGPETGDELAAPPPVAALPSPMPGSEQVARSETRIETQPTKAPEPQRPELFAPALKTHRFSLFRGR